MRDRVRHRAGVATAAVLAGPSAQHVYWAAGGRAGPDAVIPERDGRKLFRPLRAGTGAVALLLSGAALTVVGCVRPDAVPARVAPWPRRGTRLLSLVFAPRAVGDFGYAGLFKRVRGTRFARWDTALYEPLCALLAPGCAFAASADETGVGQPRT